MENPYLPRDKQGVDDIELEDEDVVLCEKCGDETSVRAAGDEYFNWCANCKWITY